MRFELNGKSLAVITLLAFSALVVVILYGMYYFVDRGSGYQSVAQSLDGVAGIAGAAVAIVLAVIAIRVSNLAEVSQSPEYQAAFQSYQAVWELDALTSALEVGGFDGERLAIIKEKVLSVAFRPELMMLLRATEDISVRRQIDTKQRLRDIASEAHEGADQEKFRTAVAGLRSSALNSLLSLRDDRTSNRKNSYLHYVKLVTRELGVPAAEEGEELAIGLMTRDLRGDVRQVPDLPAATESDALNAGLASLIKPIVQSLKNEKESRFSVELGSGQVLPEAQLVVLVDAVHDAAGLDFEWHVVDRDQKIEPLWWMLPGRRSLVVVADDGKQKRIFLGIGLLQQKREFIENESRKMICHFDLMKNTPGPQSSRSSFEGPELLESLESARDEIEPIIRGDGSASDRTARLSGAIYSLLEKSIEKSDYRVIYLGIARESAKVDEHGELAHIIKTAKESGARCIANDSAWERSNYREMTVELAE